MILLDVAVEAEGWAALGDPAGLCQRAADAALAAASDRHRPAGDVAVTILLADDDEIRGLNREWRGEDKATNVLSFPAEFMTVPTGHARPGGDLALAFETVAAEAEAAGTALGDHVSHLVVHGIFHLFGYRHDDDGDADRMEAAEVDALARLGIADPYRPAA